jgi:negative regulator of sigma E activity
MDTGKIGEIIARAGEPSFASGRHAQVQGLLDLAEQVQGILVPVEPDANFRRRLHGDLLLQAQRRQTVQQVSPFVQHRKGILIGAAAVGSVASVAGLVIAFVLHYRHRGATHIAT